MLERASKRLGRNVFSRFLCGVASSFLCVGVVACGGGSNEASLEEAERAVETPEEAQAVNARFDGVFQHETRLHGHVMLTRLEIGADHLKQFKDELVVYDAPCERETKTRRRVTFRCTEESGRVVVWPFELDDAGALFHRAQPELRFVRVE